MNKTFTSSTSGTEKAELLSTFSAFDSSVDKVFARIQHLEKSKQLDQIYEWVKTGHITRSEFKGMIGRI